MLAPDRRLPMPVVTRRQGLTALAVLGPIGFLAACSSSSDADPIEPTAVPATVSTAVAAQEQELVQLYDATIAAYPEIAAALQVIRDQHQQHAMALDASSSPSSAPPTEIAESVDRALVALVSAEKKAMRQRIDACVEAEDAGLARTLAFIAASESSHVPALRDLRA